MLGGAAALATACTGVAPGSGLPPLAPSAASDTRPRTEGTPPGVVSDTQPRTGGTLRVGVLGDLLGLDGHLTTGLDSLRRVWDVVSILDEKLATGAIEHGGGVRFAAGSLEYRVIAEWIAAGMPGPSASDPEIRGLTVFPAALRLAPGQSQQVLVQAAYSDGRVEDVTHWAKFASTDDSVASVDENGRLEHYKECRCQRKRVH